MLIALHKNARTTPAVRAEIAASDETAGVLAQRYGITEQTVYKWKKRSVFGDRSHTAHRLQTVLTPAQEVVVVHLRRTLLLPLDDLLAVTREFICPHVSRSGLDRCLRRHGAGNLNALKPQEPQPVHKAFKSYEPGYVHMDVKYLPQMQDESQRRYLFVAIDRATRWVFVQLKSNKTAASAQAFLRALHKACPIRITKLLTDNGKEFTDRLFASREREPSGNHEFDRLCQELRIEHRLTKPRTPRTNGMVERFNGRIADVLKTHRFNSREDMEQTLLRYVALYNHQLPQSALGSKTPMQAMKQWYLERPDLFHKRPYDRPGCNTYVHQAVVAAPAIGVDNAGNVGLAPDDGLQSALGGIWHDLCVNTVSTLEQPEHHGFAASATATQAAHAPGPEVRLISFQLSNKRGARFAVLGHASAHAQVNRVDRAQRQTTKLGAICCGQIHREVAHDLAKLRFAEFGTLEVPVFLSHDRKLAHE